MTALAQLYALYSHRARSFNQWQHALYPNFIINSHRARSFNQWQRALYPNFITEQSTVKASLFVKSSSLHKRWLALYGCTKILQRNENRSLLFVWSVQLLKIFSSSNWKKFHLTWGWKSSKTMSLADELQFYQVQKIIFRLLFCNSSSRSVEDDSSLVGCSTRRLTI